MWGGGGQQWVGLSGGQPDFGNTLARVMQIKATQQQSENVARETEAQNRLMALLGRPGFVRSLGQNDPNALAELGAVGPTGLNLALPRLDELRQTQEWQAFRRGNAPQAAPGGAPVASGAGVATPAASAPLPGLAGVPEQWRGAVEASARLRGVDPDDLANLLTVESGWNPNAVSPRGARGLGQQMPGTAAELGIDPRDPQQSIDGAARYLAQQQQRFGRTGGFAAYNAGPGRVAGVTQNGEINLASLPAETQQYVMKLAGEGGGASPLTRTPQLPGMPTPAEFARAMELAPRNRLAAAFVQQWKDYFIRPLEPGRDVPYSPEVLRQRRELAEAGRTAVNVDQRGDTSFSQTYGRTLAEQAANLAAAPRVAAQTQSRLARAERLLERFETGAFANARLTAGNIAQQMGVPDSVLQSLGISKDQVAAGEGVRSIASQLLLGMIGPGGFPAQNFSNADREMLEKAILSLSNTREGNRQVIASLREAAKLDERVGREWLRFSRANGATSESYQRFLDEKVPEITAGVDPYAGLIEAWQSATLSNEPAPPGAVPGPGGQGTATPPPPASGGGWSIRPVR